MTAKSPLVSATSVVEFIEPCPPKTGCAVLRVHKFERLDPPDQMQDVRIRFSLVFGGFAASGREVIRDRCEVCPSNLLFTDLALGDRIRRPRTG
jgi:hypothetical protein